MQPLVHQEPEYANPVFHVLGNMQQAVDAADDRLQKAEEQLRITLQESLLVREEEIKTLKERLALADRRIQVLQGDNQTLTLLQQDGNRIFQAQIAALQIRANAYEEEIAALKASEAANKIRYAEATRIAADPGIRALWDMAMGQYS